MTDHIGDELGKDWEELGMTTPRDWPNSMAVYRDQTAEAAMAGIKAIQPVFTEPHITEAEMFKRMTVVTHNLDQIVKLMIKAGAQVDPSYEEYWSAPRW